MLYDTETGFAPRRQTYWSSYYDQNERTPEDVQPSPWVVARKT